MRHLPAALSLLLCVCALPCAAATPAVTTTVVPGIPTAASADLRQTDAFCQGWRFLREDAPRDAKDAAREMAPAAAAFDDAAWERVSLPHTPRIDSPMSCGHYFLGGCWYRHAIAVNPAWSNKRVSLEFDGAMQKADIWVNGQKVGTHLGGYLPFVVDLTPHLAGHDRIGIALHLDNNGSALFPPGSNRIDFTYQGGLYRPVRLVVTDPVHITNAIEAGQVAGGGVFVRCESATAAAAAVAAQTHVRNDGATSAKVEVEHVLLAPDGREVARQTVAAKPLAPGAGAEFASTLKVGRPQLWHPDHPWLYTLVSTVRKNGVACDRVRTRCGLRRLAVTDEGFFLNGERIMLRGANRHMSFPWLGNAGSDNMQYRDIRLLKEGGFNFLRLCHYPQSAAVMEACDELGMMALVCTPGWQCFQDNDSFKREAKKNIREMVRWNRNHPSAVLWETSLNETYGHDAFHEECSDLAKAEYPGGQLLTCGDTYGAKRTRFYDVTYSGWRGSYDRPRHPDAKYRKALHREYGDMDVGGAIHVQERTPDDKWMLAQAWHFQWTHNKNLSWPWTLGDAVWEGIDTPSAFGPSFCGPLDIYRLPKFGYYFYQSQRSPVAESAVPCETGPMVHIASYWTPRAAQVKVVVYSNAQAVELFLNGKSLGRRKPDSGPDTAYGQYSTGADPMWVGQTDPAASTRRHDADARAQFGKSASGKIFDGGNCAHLDHAPFTFIPVRYAPGELKAVAYIGGQAVATDIRRTPGKPAALRLRAALLGKPLAADGADTVFVYAQVVDARGEVCPDSQPTVRFKAEGAGHLVMPALSVALAGIAPMMVQAGNTPGTVTVTATAKDLPPATLEIRSQGE